MTSSEKFPLNYFCEQQYFASKWTKIKKPLERISRLSGSEQSHRSPKLLAGFWQPVVCFKFGFKNILLAYFMKSSELTELKCDYE